MLISGDRSDVPSSKGFYFPEVAFRTVAPFVIVRAFPIQLLAESA
jgi:hypothetical protein